MQATSRLNGKEEAKVYGSPVTLGEARAINVSLGKVFSPTDVITVGRLAIEAAARARASGGVPVVFRRVTTDADFYVQEPISQRKLGALYEQGFRPDEGAKISPFGNDRIVFLRKRVEGRTIPVQIFQRDVFDHRVTESGYNIRIVNTQDEIMRGAKEVDGLRVPAMAFMVAIKAVAHVERYVRYANRESYLKTDKNGKDVGFILSYVLEQTPERFMDENKDTIRHLLRDDKESNATLLRVMREAYSPNGHGNGIRQRLGL